MSHADYLINKKLKTLRKLSDEENEAKDEAYLKRYALDKETYESKWLPIRQGIFDMKVKWFPSMLFQPGFEFIYDCPWRRAILSRYQLARLKTCMRALGEKEFVLIQNEVHFNYTRMNPKYDPERFKYPATITYTQLLDGGRWLVGDFIQDWIGINDCFIFSENGQWGVYSPGDDQREDTWFFIIGFRPAVAPLFTEVFKDLTTAKEKQYILEKCLPAAPAYQPYDKYLR